MKIDQAKAEIITRHIAAMFKELNADSDDLQVLGIAGGIILSEMGPQRTGSGCHVFSVLDPSVVGVLEGSTVFGEDAFVADVAKTMLAEVAS